MKTKFLFLTLILFLSLPVFSIHAASSGPNSPASASIDSSVGTKIWANITNILANDDVIAHTTFSLNDGDETQYLIATDFGFSIPSDATINGIAVMWRRFDLLGAAGFDKEIRIVKGGVIGSTDRSSLDMWPNTLTDVSYGGSTDLWGETWTASDINASTFGATLRAQAIGGNGRPRVDYVSITVYYTEAASSSSGGSRKAVSYPSYTMNFSDGTGSLIAETILPGQVGYVNNYLSTTTPSLPPTPTTEPTPLPVTPQVSDVKQQITSLIQQLIQLLQAEILKMQTAGQ